MRKSLTILCLLLPLLAAAQQKAQVVSKGQEAVPLGRVVRLSDFFPRINNRYVYQPKRPENPPIPVLNQATPGEANTLQVGTTQDYQRIAPGALFPGIDSTGFDPADPSLAVGPNHIMMVVNSRFAVYSKSTGVALDQQDFVDFFNLAGTGAFMFDPKIVYDRIAGRWVMLIIRREGGSYISRVYLAISATTDPSGDWYQYPIDAKQVVDQENCWIDYPGLGYNKDAYIVSGNLFTFIGTQFKGTEYLIIRKSSILGGGTMAVTKLTDNDAFTLQPAEMFSPTADRIYGVSRYFTDNQFKIYAFTNLAATPSVSSYKLAIPTYVVPDSGAPTPGNQQFLDTIDARPINAAWRDGKLVTSHTVKGASGRHVVRWYEINTNNFPGVNPTLAQTGEVQGTDHLHMGSISKNAPGDIALVFTRSNATSRVADIMASGRRVSDGYGQTSAPVLLQASDGTSYGFPQSTNRWGDYSMVAVDPSDETSFWVAHMRGKANTDWTTSFFKFLVTVPLTPANLTVSASSLNGGTPITGTVTMSGTAGPGGATVSLTSNKVAASVPVSATVAQGTSSKSFTITTFGVDSDTVVTITASSGSVSKTANFTVKAALANSLSLASSVVAGGNSTTGTVTLTAKAGPSGTVVNLGSNKPQATVPATVSVPAQTTSASFTINATNPSVDTTAQISATRGVTKVANLTVKKTPALYAFTLNPTTVFGGQSTQGAVTLQTAAPAPTSVTLSDNTSVIAVPASVLVKQGFQSGGFTATTSSVSSTIIRQIYASLNGVTKTANLTLQPGAALASLQLNPTSVKGGNNSTGTVTLTSPAPSGGIVVSLSDNSSVLSVPPSVTVAAGATIAGFTVTTTPVSTTATRQVTATRSGITKTANLTITP